MTIEEAIKHAENIYRQEDEKSDCKECAEQHKQLTEWLEELQQYRAIGTVEECRAARERQIPEKPNIWGDGYDNEGNMIYDMYDCPNCGKSYEIDCQDYNHCPECGQAIDWEEVKA